MTARPTLTFTLCALLASGAPDAAPRPEPTLAVTAVNLVDGESGEVLDDRTILIAGDRIVDVLEGGPRPGRPSSGQRAAHRSLKP